MADGLYRVTAGREIALSGFPSVIKDLTDDDLLAIQIQANAVRPETTPLEYARQIRRIIDSRPGIKDYELVGIIHKSPRWIRDTLGLDKLRKDFQLAVERGEMSLGSAYELARIPYKHQAEFFDAARTMPVAEFRAMAQSFLKQFQEAVRQGKLDAFFTEDFKPVAHMRPLKEVLPEYENPAQAALLLAAENCATPLAAWHIGAGVGDAPRPGKRRGPATSRDEPQPQTLQGGARQATLARTYSFFHSPILRQQQCPTTRAWSL